jgi:DNA-binding IclR family transcriptional regulator
MPASGIENLRNRVRQAGFAFVGGKFLPGLVAIAVPILEWQGEAQAVVTLIGTDVAILDADSTQVSTLKAYCAARSVDMGRPPMLTLVPSP